MPERCTTKTITKTKTVTVTAGTSPTTTVRPSTSSAPVMTSAPASTAVVPAVPSIPAGAIALDVNFGDYTGGGAEAFLNKHSELGRPRAERSSDLLGVAEFHVSAYTVDSEPRSHTFVKQNVDIVQGKLQLTVKGGAKGDVSSAEVFSDGELNSPGV